MIIKTITGKIKTMRARACVYIYIRLEPWGKAVRVRLQTVGGIRELTETM